MATMLRRSKIWRGRCQCVVATLAALALLVFNYIATTNVWMPREAPCEQPHGINEAKTTVPAVTCEPCSIASTAQSAVDDDPLARLDLRLGRWDGARAYRLYDYAAVGDSYADASADNRVCLATQTSIDRIGELLRLAAHWSGPISLAVFTAGDEFRLLRGYATWLFLCEPELYARLALHVAMPAGRPGSTGRLPSWARDCSQKPSPGTDRAPATVQWRTRHAYPQNHMRNLARKNCHTSYVFLVDIDIIPSKGMAEALNVFLSPARRCALCAYVVPTYELDRRVALFPASKKELLRLSRLQLAMPFHKKVFIYNQFASNFSRWESSGGNESSAAHVSHNVTNFELFYEPFYIAADTAPPHDERFVGYGFTRNTQPRGRRIPRVMMEARVPVVPHWLCRLSYGDALTNNMFCGGHFLIGGVSSCQGDSGGPAVFRGTVFGIVSFARGCALPLSPTVFTNVAAQRLWIAQNTAVYEMFLIGYQFQVLSPIFTIHWGIQSRVYRPLWREKQNEGNRKHFETFKRELFARYRKDPLHLLRKPPPKKPA